VLSPVALCLFAIPLVDHSLSLPHPRRETKRGPLRCEFRGISNCGQKDSDE
jgi:hypothetical protein